MIVRTAQIGKESDPLCSPPGRGGGWVGFHGSPPGRGGGGLVFTAPLLGGAGGGLVFTAPLLGGAGGGLKKYYNVQKT